MKATDVNVPHLALLLFQTHEYWIVNFPEDFFRTETSDLVTFLDKSPTITRKSFKTDELEIDNIFHAQCYHPPKEISTTALLVAFLKVCSTKKKIFFCILKFFFQQVSDGIYLVQKSLSAETGEKMVKHEVPPATAANGQKGDITSVRFW